MTLNIYKCIHTTSSQLLVTNGVSTETMEKNGGINQAAFKAAIFLCLLINMLTVGVVCYGWYNTAWESTLQRNINARLMKRIGFLEKVRLRTQFSPQNIVLLKTEFTKKSLQMCVVRC